MEDIERAKEVVLRFVEEINDWEEKMFILHRIQDGKHVPLEDKARVEGQNQERLNEQFAKTFAAHCTVRERKYSEHHSFGKPTKYAGISASTIVEAQQPKPSRIEITTDQELGNAAHKVGLYIFVLLKKNGDWKIDSLKKKYDGKAPVNAIL